MSHDLKRDKRAREAAYQGRVAKSHVLAAARSYRRASLASGLALLTATLVAAGGLDGPVGLSGLPIKPMFAAVVLVVISALLASATIYNVLCAVFSMRVLSGGEASGISLAETINSFAEGFDLSNEASAITIFESRPVRILVAVFQIFCCAVVWFLAAAIVIAPLGEAETDRIVEVLRLHFAAFVVTAMPGFLILVAGLWALLTN